jgi:HEAT repeat protein
VTDTLIGLNFSDQLLWALAFLIIALFVGSFVLVMLVVHLRLHNLRRARQRADLEAQWEPIILEVLAGGAPDAKLHALVKPEDEGYFVSFLMRYSTRLKGDEREAVLDLSREYLPAVALQLKRRSPERRARAVQTLGELDAHGYTDDLMSALSDPSPLVAITAARALARQRNPDLAQGLVASFGAVELWHKRFLSSMLASMGPKSGAILRDALGDPNRPTHTRVLAAETLVQLNDLAAADSATAVIQTETDTDLLVAALRLIQRVGGEEQREPVKGLLQAPDPAVRANAVRALACVGTQSDVDLVRSAVEDESNWVVMHAVWGLKALGRLDVLRELVSSNHHRAAAAREMLAEVPA